MRCNLHLFFHAPTAQSWTRLTKRGRKEQRDWQKSCEGGHQNGNSDDDDDDDGFGGRHDFMLLFRDMSNSGDFFVGDVTVRLFVLEKRVM